MRAVVLAAGRGTRLGGLTTALPKTLLKVTNDDSILDRTLLALSANGVHEIGLVAGHAASELTAALPELMERHGVHLDLLMNDRVDLNNAYSLWSARGLLNAGALVVNGDTVVGSELVSRMVGRYSPTEVVVAVDFTSPPSDEAMKVALNHRSSSVARFSKGLEDADGEYIGLAIVGAEAAASLGDALGIAWDLDGNHYYEDAFNVFIGRGGRVRAVDVTELHWDEVDDASDLDRVRSALAAQAGTPPVSFEKLLDAQEGVRVSHEVWELRAGDKTFVGDYLRAKTGGVIIVCERNRRLLTGSQFRIGPGASSIEFPMGAIDLSDSSALAAARRELAEETGMSGGKWRSLGSIFPLAGVSNLAFQVFVATDVGEHGRTDHEVDALEWRSVGDLRSAAARGQIRCALTLGALMLYLGEDEI